MTVLDADTTARGLVDRFDALSRFVRTAWTHLGPDSGVSDGEREAVSAAGMLSERAGARLRLSGGHTVVALAGATGSGKSSLFNALARMRLSAPGHLRPTTAEAHACVWGDADADPLLDWLGVTHRFARESALDGADEAGLHGLVLLDLPDVDSVATGHRLEAQRLVGVVDLVIWVLDPQKYADQTVHDEYLRRMGPLRDVTVVVFNQTDRLSPADALRCRTDLARLVGADGLPDVPVVATSARTGDGVDDLRALLESAVAGRPAALARLAGELDHTVDDLAPLVRPRAVRPDEPIDRDAVATLADELAVAAGVPAVAAEAGRAYLHRAALPGWPLQRRSTVDMDVPPADPAAVGAAVRRIGATAATGLPAPWPDEVQSAVGHRARALPEDLGGVLHRATPRLPRRYGWLVARVLWWLGLAAVVGGAGWYGWHALRGGPDLPRVAGVVLPLALVAAGAVVAVLVLSLGRPLAMVRARRFRSEVQDRLRAATTTVARETVAPARGVLRDYDDASAALWAASGQIDRGARV